MRILKSLKTLIRCRDLERSRSFYMTVLGLEVVQEWQQSQAKGCILAFGDGGKGGFLELAEVAPDSDRHDPAYALPVANDKIELQIKTDSVDAWAEALRGVCPTEGPVDRPWGHRYLWLRDPDHVRIALFEGEV